MRHKIENVVSHCKDFLIQFHFHEGADCSNNCRIFNKVDDFEDFGRKTDKVEDAAMTIVTEVCSVDQIHRKEMMKEAHNPITKSWVFLTTCMHALSAGGTVGLTTLNVLLVAKIGVRTALDGGKTAPAWRFAFRSLKDAGANRRGGRGMRGAFSRSCWF